METLTLTQPVTAIHTSTGQAVVELKAPSFEDIEAAVKALEALMSYDGNYPRQRITIEFDKPSKVRVDSRNEKSLKSAEMRFFNSRQGNFCYTFYSSTGYPLSYMEYRNIRRLSIDSKPLFEGKRIKKVLALGRRIHPNAWDDLKAKILAKPKEYLHYYTLGPISIAGKFPSHVLDQIKKAFETKADFRYDGGFCGKRRDFSVSTRLCPDGIFRAWFSSEYHGCGNGSYYLLINPTTAAFREDD